MLFHYYVRNSSVEIEDDQPDDKGNWGKGFALRATSKHSAHPPAGPPPKKKRKYQDEYPDWATFENDAKAWRNELSQMGVDDHAQKMLFCLAQHNEKGKECANTVIWHVEN